MRKGQIGERRSSAPASRGVHPCPSPRRSGRLLSGGNSELAFPDILGAGRFATIGIPYPEILGPFVGVVEHVCGALVIVGLFTRLAAIPLLTMIVAVVSTKVPILLGHDFWIFHPEADALRLPEHAARGARRFRHAARLLLIEGAGAWSPDARLAGRSDPIYLQER